MSFLVAAASLVALWVAGVIVLAATGLRGPAAPSSPAAAFAAGVSLLAFLGMLTVVVGGKMSLLTLYVPVAALAAALLVRGARPAWPPRPRLPTDRRAASLLVATAFLLLILAAVATQDRLLWDGWALWAFKSRVLFLEGTIPDALLDGDGQYAWAHPSYPLALPFTQWWAYAHAGGPTPALASFTGSFFLLFVPMVLWRSLRRQAGAAWAAAAAFGSVAFWPMTKYAIGGYAEILMTLAILGAVVELERGLGRDRPGAIGRYAIFLTLGSLAKSEGLALALVGIVVGLIRLRTEDQRLSKTSLWLLTPLLAIGPWFIFTRMRGLGSPHLARSTSFAEVMSRIPTLFMALGELGVHRAWTAVSLLLIAGALARFSRGERGTPAPWLLLLGYFATTQMVYLVAPFDLDWLLGTTLERIAGTLVPAAVFLSIHEIVLMARRHEDPGANPAHIQ